MTANTTGKKSLMPVLGTINGRVFVLTFAVLALELAVIRFTGGQVRIFAYFGNLVLIVVFLGLGLGVGIGRNGRSYLCWAVPGFALLAALLSFAPQLGITTLVFPDTAIALWGAEGSTSDFEAYRSLAVFAGFIVLIAFSFGFLGTELGALFCQAGPRSVDAYVADLAGSLAGSVCFAAMTLFHLAPPAWFALGIVPLLLLDLRARNTAMVALILICATVSIGGADYSPYNRIDIGEHDEQGGIRVNVNRDFHQIVRDFSQRNLARFEQIRSVQAIYDAPFRLTPRGGSAAIVGAGTGNDADAALRSGFERVMAVDIDPLILDIGARLHPAAPYKDPRVTLVNDDARAFFRQYDGPAFDAVVFGLLDSHAMFSSLSSIRLDNFVYTVEGLRDAWQHVADDGVMVVGFSIGSGAWLADRLYRTVHKATGIEPVAFYHGMHYGATFIVSRDAAVLTQENVLRAMQAIELRWMTFDLERPGARMPTDDWPYLYIRPGAVPWLYMIVIGLVLLLALGGIPLAYGTRALGSHFSAPMFFIGAAFLLIETRGVTALSLLYGSTWVVNALVFIGVLTMALAAALVVRQCQIERAAPWFAMLILSTVALWQLDLAVFNDLPLGLRGVIGALVHAVPIFFAGVLFPILLRQATNPAGALGSNLLGAVCGGCVEFASMLVGLQALIAIAAVMYLLAALTYQSRSPGKSADQV